jgi:hypothetical protein
LNLKASEGSQTTQQPAAPAGSLGQLTRESPEFAGLQCLRYGVQRRAEQDELGAVGRSELFLILWALVVNRSRIKPATCENQKRGPDPIAEKPAGPGKQELAGDQRHSGVRRLIPPPE